MKNFKLTPPGLFIIAYHVGLLVGLPLYFYYQTPSTALIVISVALLFLTEIGIGAAFHRFYAHRCYSLSKPAEAMLLLFGSLASQGSVLRWSYDHRMHHARVDTDDDPYAITKGFWYAHVMWLFEQNKPIQDKVVSDLLENPLVRLQHRFAGALAIFGNAAVFVAVGWLVNDYLGAFVLAWWTRLLVSHHLTWFVNSLAHCWGERTFSKEQSAVDNYVLAFLTVGEGYHNYHHTFPSDYRNGVRWYHFDPVKWTIWSLSKLGQADNLKRFCSYRARRRLVLEDRKLLLANMKQHAQRKAAELEEMVESLSGRLQERLQRMSKLADQIRDLKRARTERATLRSRRQELKTLRSSLRRDWRDWMRLCDQVLQPSPAA